MFQTVALGDVDLRSSKTGQSGRAGTIRTALRAINAWRPTACWTCSVPSTSSSAPAPPSRCEEPSDPFNLPKSPIEKWLTKEVYYDLFPKANIGHGPHVCSPYSYEAFVIAARYFPKFGGESPDNGYDSRQNARRDLAAFSHTLSRLAVAFLLHQLSTLRSL